MRVPLGLVLAAVLLAEDLATALGRRAKGNPVSKVVTLLQKLESKVSNDGEIKEQLFDKFMCHCKTSIRGIKSSITAAEERAPQLESSIREVSAQHKQLKADLKAKKQDRADATQAIASAEAIRKKDAEAFEVESTTLNANIEDLSKASAALTQGWRGGSAFLQTRAATRLRRLIDSLDMTTADRDHLSAFLSGGGSDHYDPESGAVLGILKQLQDHMQDDLKELQQQEASSVENHEHLVASNSKRVAATTKAVEEKAGRAGELAVELTQLQDDLEDTREGLAEDQAFLTDLQHSCKRKTAAWELYKKAMGEELLAISETIKLLNDDEVHNMFRKTMPTLGTSFLQLDGHRTHTHKAKARRKKKRSRRQAAAADLRRAGRRSGDARTKLLEMALRGEKGGLEKVTPMIDQLIALLKKEQIDDDKKKAFCTAKADKAQNDKTEVATALADKNTVLSDTKDTFDQTSKEIAALSESIKQLDTDVDEATTIRKAEHATVVEELAEANAAVEVLSKAKDTLNQFYSQKRTAPVGTELAATQTDSTGADASGGVASLDAEIKKLGSEDHGGMEYDGQRDQESDAPTADLAYVKRTEESGGVIAMIDLIQEDFQKHITQINTEDKAAQEDYEAFLQSSKKKRALDSKAIADKSGYKSELEANMHKDTESVKQMQDELTATESEIAILNQDCTWLLQNHEARKKAREDESEALKMSKATLLGANYAL